MYRLYILPYCIIITFNYTNLISVLLFFFFFPIGFDIDQSAIELSIENAIDRDVCNRCDFVLCDLTQTEHCIKPKQFDTVILNPPFGTRDKGSDLKFLKTALSIATSAVYSLHKTSTRNHIMRKARELKVIPKVIAELRYDLPASYAFHKKDSIDVKVDLIRFQIPSCPVTRSNVVSNDIDL